MSPGLRRASRGQVLVLAVLLALLLCAAVLITVSLGQAAHERVRLQHTADAAAYSVAVAEARTFNLYADLNRAEASHYVTAMLWHSLLSHLFFTEAFLTDVTGLAHSLPCSSPDGEWVAICAAARRVPQVGPTLTWLSNFTDVLTELTRDYQRGLNGGDPGRGDATDAVDSSVGVRVVPAFLEINAGLSAVAQSVMQDTFTIAREGGVKVALANDPGLSAADVSAESARVTACYFSRAHSSAALGRPDLAPVNPFMPLRPSARNDVDRTARAKRVMAGIANATRAGCDVRANGQCPDEWATARTKVTYGSLEAALDPVRPLLDATQKWGQTRLLSFRMGGADNQNFIRDPDGAPDAPTGMLAQGDNLGADDGYQLPLGRLGCGKSGLASECFGEPRRSAGLRGTRAATKTSIWALNEEEATARPGGIHWRVAYPAYPLGPGHRAPADLGNDHPELTRLGLHEARRRFFGIHTASVYVANVRPIQDGHHPWAGIVPFPLFEPGQFRDECAEGAPEPADAPALRESDFNQPSVWVSLQKPGSALLKADAEWGSAAPAPIRLGLRQERPAPRPGTLHAFARAQAYYHRPQDWAEQPNFFNPFWRARLAATLQSPSLPKDVQQWIEQLPEPLRSSPGRVLTH